MVTTEQRTKGKVCSKFERLVKKMQSTSRLRANPSISEKKREQFAYFCNILVSI